MNRAPFQVLVFPYRILESGKREYALFKRNDDNIWLGIAGGGESNETPVYAAIRESHEEAGISNDSIYLRLDSVAHIPVTDVVGDFYWGKECYVIPEYSFGVRINKTELVISSEHTEYQWFSILEALEMLKWDSNKTVIWELDKRLENGGESNNRKKKHRIRAAALIVNEKDEHYIKDVRWFSKEALSNIAVYPEIIKNSFWTDYKNGFSEMKYLGRQIG